MPQIHFDPYLFFTGNCREAMEFYKSIFGGELTFMPNENGSGIMHAVLNSDAVRFMASDGSRTTPYDTSFISLSLSGTDTERLTEIFNKLSEGGKITDPLSTKSWGDVFGALTDKYGVDWVVNISAK